MNHKCFTIALLLSASGSFALTTAHHIRPPFDPDLKGYYTDQIVWKDASGHDRIAELATDTIHPVGAQYCGGHMQSYKYMNGTTQKTCPSLSAWGFGATINHGNFPGSAWGAWIASSFDGSADSSWFLFKGTHHAIWAYRNKLSLFGKGTAPFIWVNRHWVFSDGQDQFQYAISFDATTLPADTVEHFEDARTPYNDFCWWGTPDYPKNMYSIGTSYRGIINSADLTFDLTTAYNQCPFIIAYKTDEGYDDELGLVQTRLYTRHHCLRASELNGKSGSFSGPDGFDFQLSGYQGWSGGRTCWNADKPDGQNQPYTTYGTENFSITAVIGRHSDGAAERCLAEANAIQNGGTSLNVTTGTIQTRSTEGVGLFIERDWDKPGFDQVYRTWNIIAADNVAQASLTVQSGQHLGNPAFVVENYTVSALPTVTLDNTAQTDGNGCWISIDTAAHRAWVTFNADFSGTHTIRIAGPSDAGSINVSNITVNPSQFTIPQSASVTVSVVAGGGSVNRVELDTRSLQGAIVSMNGSGNTYSRSISVPANVPDGKRKLVVRAYDSQGRWREADTFVIARRPDRFIYSDDSKAVASSWQNHGSIVEKSGGAFEGSKRLEFTYDGRTDIHCGIEFRDTVDMRPYKFLAFAYNGPTSGQGFSITLSSRVTTRSTNAYHFPSVNNWTKVIVPIRSIDVGSGFTTSMGTDMHFWFDSTTSNTTGTFNFDNLYLTSWPDDAVGVPTPVSPVSPLSGELWNSATIRQQGRLLVVNLPIQNTMQVLDLKGRVFATLHTSQHERQELIRISTAGIYLARNTNTRGTSIRKIIIR